MPGLPISEKNKFWRVSLVQNITGPQLKVSDIHVSWIRTKSGMVIQAELKKCETINEQNIEIHTIKIHFAGNWQHLSRYV